MGQWLCGQGVPMQGSSMQLSGRVWQLLGGGGGGQGCLGRAAAVRDGRWAWPRDAQVGQLVSDYERGVGQGSQ